VLSFWFVLILLSFHTEQCSMHYANVRGNDQKNKSRHGNFFPLFFSNPYGIFSWTEVVKKSLGGVPEFLVWPNMGSVFVGARMHLRTEFCWNLPTWFVCWKGMNSKPTFILCDQQSADDGACLQTCDSDHVDNKEPSVFGASSDWEIQAWKRNNMHSRTIKKTLSECVQKQASVTT
jgi:hypothetical protein